MRIIDQQMLDEVTGHANGSLRRRMNHNLHPSDEFPCHRLLNAMEPDSYIRPHCHLHPNKDESMIMLRGRMGVVAFDNEGNVTLARIISSCGSAVAVDIPHGTFHTVVSLASGTVFFEAKAGPYAPLTDEEKATWAPEEGSPEASAYLGKLKGLFLKAS